MTVDVKAVIKHLSNGTLGENLCIVCLGQLNDDYENIQTKICNEQNEFCVADVLESVCQTNFTEEDNYNVCTNCFKTAFMAQKFYMQSSRSKEILNFYSHHLTHTLDYINSTEEFMNNTLCISVPSFIGVDQNLNLNLEGIGKQNIKEHTIAITEPLEPKMIVKEDDDNIVVVVQDNGEPLFYKMNENGTLILLDEKEKMNYKKTLSTVVTLPEASKERRKRMPMPHKQCSRCPVKYRFTAKLKEHMKREHGVHLYVCMVCKATTENSLHHYNHMRTHTNIHQCAICQIVFKKRDTIINHLKWHEKMKNISQTDGAHICEICGVITEDENSLKEHYNNKHYKKYTCYFCGRLYKGENSFEAHIKKHEKHSAKSVDKSKTSELLPQKKEVKSTESNNKQKCMCLTCGKYFVDERALMWHQRLHNNERPYQCEVCGRGFVSLNRRNQHTLCAHTAPTRRCPLCPALFHLRSIVNTHVKKVHLKAHKQRHRIPKHQNVYWRTEIVPIQELSVEIQNQILDMQVKMEPESMMPNPTQVMDIDL